MYTVTSSHLERALTTDAHTQWSHQEILYAHLSNLPQAWSTVYTVSRADFPVLGWISTGIHLQLSWTVTDQSSFNIEVTSLQYQANASSTALSTISCTIWCNHLESVEPIYIQGLCLTGSSHSRTLICDASYSCVCSGVVVIIFFFQ